MAWSIIPPSEVSNGLGWSLKPIHSLPMLAKPTSAILAAALIVSAISACHSIGPSSVTRDRSDYGAAIGNSWKQQTLLNIVKLRYGDFPVFMEIAQVIAGYQLQTTVGAGVSAQNFNAASIGGPVAVGGSVAAAATYTDRPTVIYAPLTGSDFIKKLMTPIPPAAVLFLLQSGYSATLVMPIAVDSVNGITNESRRAGMTRPGDPDFARLTQLLYELQVANALQIRIERSKDHAETAVVGFPPTHVGPDVLAKTVEVRRILRLGPPHRAYLVRYGGWSGKSDEIAIVTRSMLQVMLELGILAQVPENDITGGRATPGAAGPPSPVAPAAGPLLNIRSSASPPPKSYVAIPYKGRWFWIGEDDIRSKSLFTSVMLLFSISDVGVRSAPPVVTVPAN